VLVTEIDFDSTVIAGTAELIRELLGHPRLEAYPIEPSIDLTRDGDHINGSTLHP
jgi:hypothetical protein